MSKICMSSWHIFLCHKMSFLNSCRKSSLFRVMCKLWLLISNTCTSYVWVRDTFMCVTDCPFSTVAESCDCCTSSAKYGPLCIYVYIHTYIYICIYIYIWYIYTNTYVVYICAESRHNSESPANYGLLSATHVDHTYEFVTLSYVSLWPLISNTCRSHV